MKVLLIQPPHNYGIYSRPPSAFPLGAAYIAASLTKSGHLVKILDIYANQYSEQEVQKRINRLSLSFDVFCISALSTQYKYIKWLTQELKSNSSKPVILGHALATFNVDTVFKYTPVDICVIGEGERTVVDLLDNLSNLTKVKGIAYRDNSKIIFNSPREYINNLDEIDFPQRDIFPMDTYLGHSSLWSNPEIKAINIITARGCPYNCNFCSKTFKGLRLRSIENIIQEIEEIRNKYDFKGIYFTDELALINKSRIYELCRYLKKSRLSWVCQGRVNLVDMDLLKTMKDSGCKALGFGVESGSQKILNSMQKGVTVEQAINAIRATKRVGIEPIIQMMFGYPGEDDKSLEETVYFFRKIKSPTMQFSMTTALPGTKLYASALQDGLIDNEDKYLDKLDWGYYGDREILINFTNFSIDELNRKRREIENKINRYYKRYLIVRPWIACRILFNKIRSYYLCHGFKKTCKKIIEFTSYLKKDSWLI